MSAAPQRLVASIKVTTIATMISLLAPLARADTWRGTAPFCAGECLAGETQISTSDSGDGGTCLTGHKVLCRNSTPTCDVAQTETSCVGVVLICDNGFYTMPDVWHSCSKFACGACFGFTAQHILLLQPGP
jgi:hypothetical protein